ncbi:hypothetical protein [Sporosarcina sp. 6E9]|uniref:hypothetical protein n=1 Tax=Sporosarcina sp. 6E9 TaxID=2819235 RepID=UPI001B306495|nr:hypothetical protein [Sporosarcina sp. 6E9]
MQFIVTYQWEIFITIEILSVISLLTFGFLRYVLNKQRLSVLAIFTFLLLLLFEALLGILIYQETKEISTFQMIIVLFVVYACTFGIFDFLKLDRWMRKTVGKWRHIELLTERDYAILKRQKDPKYVATKYRLTSSIHLFVFLIGQSILWFYGTGSFNEMLNFLTDMSWVESGTAEQSPYANEAAYSIGMIWTLVFVIDFIYSWSFTIFPGKQSTR